MRAHGVFIDEVEGGYEMIRGDFAEYHVLEERIEKKEIRYYWRKLKIPIHHFWHPGEAEKGAKIRAARDAKDRENPNHPA